MGALQERLRAIFRADAAGRALAALSPHIIHYLISPDALILKLGLLTISLLIVMERIARSLPLLLLHAALIAAGIATVHASISLPACYVAACAALAWASAAVMVPGDRWKALGTFTLVPSLYLGSELHAAQGMETLRLAHLWPWALLPVALVIVAWEGASQWRSVERHRGLARAACATVCGALRSICRFPLPRSSARAAPGQRALAYRMALARALGAALGAGWVVLRGPDWGEWVVWSTASVVAGDWLGCQARWRDRMLGLALGLPSGVLAAYALPVNAWVSGVAALGVYLSLVSFHAYRHAYLFRCAMLALGAGSALQLATVLHWRAENVAVGCAIGILMAFIVLRAGRGDMPRGAT